MFLNISNNKISNKKNSLFSYEYNFFPIFNSICWILHKIRIVYSYIFIISCYFYNWKFYSSFLVISIIGSFIIFILLVSYKYYICCHHTNSIHWYIRIFWLKGILQPPTILFGIASFLIAIKVNIETKIDYYIQKISELSYPIFLIHLHYENIHLWRQPLIKLSHNNLVFYWKNNLHMSLKI